MSWTITPQTKVPVDPQFGSVSLLLHGNGTNGSTTITDSSPTPKTVTAVGDAKISTAQSKFGGSSIAFDGNGDYLSIPFSSDFVFGAADFTIEAWVYTTVATQQHIYEGRDINGDGVLLYINASGLLSFYSDRNIRITGGSVGLASWSHVALCKSASSSRLFLNGIQTGSTFADTSTYILRSAGPLIGQNGSNGSFVNGYIDDLRITKGVARYTSNFTPPTAPFPDI